MGIEKGPGAIVMRFHAIYISSKLAAGKSGQNLCCPLNLRLLKLALISTQFFKRKFVAEIKATCPGPKWKAQEQILKLALISVANLSKGFVTKTATCPDPGA